MGQARSACSCKRVETRGGGRPRTGVCDAQGLPGVEASDAQGLPGPPRVETLGYYWEEVVSPLGCSGKRTEVRSLRLKSSAYDWEGWVRRGAPALVSGLKSAALGHPCPNAVCRQRR